MVVPEAVDGECALAFHWVVMNSLKQFLLLAVQNAEQESETPTDAQFTVFMIALVVFLAIVTLTACWFYMKKRNPNLTAAQFWKHMFSGSNSISGGGD